MKYIKQIEDTQHLKTFVIQELKHFGIKLPKKKTRTRNDSLELNRQIFGNHLCLLPQVEVLHCGPVPKFLYEASVLLEQHADTEGIFRKSGSLARQKELKQSIEEGQEVTDANPLDMASLVKQFFRELPDPLLTSRHHDIFLKAFSLENDQTREAAILLLCLLLPWHHLSTLRFIMLFLRKISTHAHNNKMDVQNLAVCLAPNILHTNSKSDKMNTNESKLLQIQTSIVELLINNADKIGMVSDGLVEQCHLMSACFPEEDELDTVAGVIAPHNDSKHNKKGKKKRSGSFQGLMSNLSTSFSKWRKDSKHNASSVSERSTYSYMSHIDKSSIIMSSNDILNEMGEGVEGGFAADMTPKVLRKRKADEECVPFSASKKQAILQNMPHMSTLGGTPFTPAMRKRLGAGRAEIMRTPTIHFADANDAPVFDSGATPSLPRIGGAAGFGRTASSASGSSRKSPGKAGCFSPKTPKSGVRKTVRGFFKRLSGGKDVQNQLMGQDCCGEGSDREYVPVIELNSSRRKSVFRSKHRKTPSSPARLITPLKQQMRSGVDSTSTQSVASTVSTSSSCGPDAAVDEDARSTDILLTEQGATEGDQKSDLTPVSSRNHRRRFSEGAGNLRRGKPNTVKTGLPSPTKRRSIDTRFVSPDGKAQQSSTVPSTLDTSPILKEENSSPITMVTSRLEVTSMDTSTDQLLSRHNSGASITSLVLVDQTNIESDHDRAFIQESMLLDSPEIEDISEHKGSCRSLYTSTTNNSPEGGFKKPLAIDSMKAPAIQQKIINKLNQSGVSDASDSSACTVIHNGQPLLKSKLVKEHVSAVAEKRTLTTQRHSYSKATQRSHSVDSAINDCEPSETSGLTKHASALSVNSIDSGLSVGAGDKYAADSQCNLTAEESDYKKDHGLNVHAHTASKPPLPHSANWFAEEKEDSFAFQRTPSLRISHKMHDMLSKVGGVSAEVTKDGDECSMGEHVAKDSSSIKDGSETTFETAEEEEHAEKKSASRELAERHSSPFRFHNSHMRRRTGSPIRIPSIFAKADLEASKYREFAQNALRMSPKPNVKTPSLPLSTDFVNGSGFMKARARLNLGDGVSPEFNNPNAGSTPSRLLHKLKFSSVDIPNTDPTPKENIENTPATPKIKEGLLLPAKHFIPKLTESSDNGNSSVRTPVKPVKRLQGPSPGVRYSKSPKHVTSSSSLRHK